MRVRIGAAAQRDVLEAQAWYAAQRPGLDLELRAELDRTLENIRRAPEAFPVLYKQARRANLSRFPYGLFYVIRTDCLFVLAVVRHARHPRHWKRRT
ncbi:MAG TPA: type II toxin-antitoxin system RelE/ParE family toxin [Thermoanaerobaculia bacterium]|jgi:plasmid stabilization system protein ParE